MSDIINIIPTKEIQFKTKSLLEDILNRLELSQRDRIDLQRYIEFGGGENLDNIKETLEFVRDNLNIFIENRHNFEIFVEYVDKIYALFEEAPEEFDTLKEIADAILKHVNEDFKEFKDEVAKSNESINEEINKRLKIEDSPIEKGEGENSAILKGGNNQALSENSVAVGSNNVVGLKGFYYKSIQFIADNYKANIFISEKQVIPTIINSSPTIGTSIDLKKYLSVGDTISIINDVKYENCAKITEIFSNNSGFRVQFNDGYPFDKIAPEILLDVEDYSVYCLNKPDAGIVDLGVASFAAGRYNKAINNNATAFGFNNEAYGKFSFVEGRDNKAGYAAHAEGRDNVASGYLSHAEGGYTLAEGGESHSEGWHTTAKGAHSHTEGTETTAEGNDSHAEGANTKTVGRASHAEGIRGTATGNYSHVEGSDSISTGVASHAEGYKTHAKGNYTHSEGQETLATNEHSHAEGFKSQAIGAHSHAEGNETKSEGINSHAEGYKSYSLGPHSHAEGNETRTEGSCAHAEGYKTQALGKYSHAEGNNTISKNKAEHACGKYNLSNSDTRFSIGIGTSDTDRKNAHEITNDGKHYIYGIGGYDGTNPDSSDDLARVIEKLQETLKYSSLTIIVEDWNDFYNKFNNVSYIEAINSNINVRYGDRSEETITLWKICDDIRRFSRIDIEIQYFSSYNRLQGTFLEVSNDENDNFSYNFIFGSEMPNEYGVIIYMFGGVDRNCSIYRYEL